LGAVGGVATLNPPRPNQLHQVPPLEAGPRGSAEVDGPRWPAPTNSFTGAAARYGRPDGAAPPRANVVLDLDARPLPEMSPVGSFHIFPRITPVGRGSAVDRGGRSIGQNAARAGLGARATKARRP